MRLRNWVLLGLLAPVIFMLAIVMFTWYATQNTKQKSKLMVQLICRNGVREINGFMKGRENVFTEWTKEDIYGTAIEYRTIDELNAHFQLLLRHHPEFCLLLLTNPNGKIITAAVPESFKRFNRNLLEEEIAREVSLARGDRFAMLVESNLMRQIGKEFRHTFLFGMKTADYSTGKHNGYFLAYLDWDKLDSKVADLYNQMKNNGFETAKVAILDPGTTRWLSHYSDSKRNITGNAPEYPVKTWITGTVAGISRTDLTLEKEVHTAIYYPIRMVTGNLWRALGPKVREFLAIDGTREEKITPNEAAKLLKPMMEEIIDSGSLNKEDIEPGEVAEAFERALGDLISAGYLLREEVKPDDVIRSTEWIAGELDALGKLGKTELYQSNTVMKFAVFVPDQTMEADVWTITKYSAITAFVGILSVFFLGFLITNTVTKRLGQAISEINTASEELKTAAKQQLSNSAEQATSTTELDTNMEEQVTSSRQISQIAGRVVASAEKANLSANDGKEFLETTVEGMETIKIQVENIVKNMLALGEKSKQMTLALDIINELSGQTTILSYNATIEAAGAGEAGKRFSALAEQIMKLANKAGDSTKEIAALIEDIQQSGNKTVLATEDGMKAVDEGMRRIQDTVQHFNRILTSSDDNLTSVKEIEMTISQQTSAIEQAARVIKSIQMAAEDVKNSSEQTLATAEQLLDMARNLSKM